MAVAQIQPDLHRLDESPKEALACAIWSDERPFAGVAGLVDFRFAGRLSRLAERRFISGKSGELLCMPGRPRLPFEKIVVIGLGERESFTEDAFRSVFGKLVRALNDLKVTSVAVELPGRADGALDVMKASELFFEWAKDDSFASSIALVEEHDAHKLFSKNLEELERKRRLQ